MTDYICQIQSENKHFNESSVRSPAIFVEMDYGFSERLLPDPVYLRRGERVGIGGSEDPLLYVGIEPYYTH